MPEAASWVERLWGTLLLRPYVYAFLLVYLVLSIRHLGIARCVTFTLGTWTIAFACEYSSTRNGFPFGIYTYVDTTRDRELWISNVPFWDSLSFVFLSYFSFTLAAAVICRRRGIESPGLRAGMLSPRAPVLGGLLMMLLDVVIDPITLRGDRWFLGRIYTYPHEGFYFGVTAANFAGWFFVGAASQWTFQMALRHLPWCRSELRPLPRGFVTLVLGSYAGVFGFLFVVTVVVGEPALVVADTVVITATLGFLVRGLRRSPRSAPAATRARAPRAIER